MNYVMHFCRNKKCNNGWIDKDLTKVKTFPPSWKYCRECAEKLGIDYDAQTPSEHRSEEEKQMIKVKLQKLKEGLKQNNQAKVPASPH